MLNVRNRDADSITAIKLDRTYEVASMNTSMHENVGDPREGEES